MARPSTYSTEVAENIFERLEAGEPLAAICRSEGMPAVRTFLDWVARDEKLAAAYTHARNAQGEWFDAEMDRIAKTAIDRDSAAAAKVQLSNLQWRASKQAPSKYGDRIDMTVDHTFDLAAVIDKRRQRALEGQDQPALPDASR
ncbi:hypothetical protein H9L12_08360 [Sphingomonas rhizophila]|uniref:Terminase small subunit protein n=1 Tax=Sphingomonas rhizophila TaxID=2071607 RepID=A0A7G9S919_9SPHN|nr:hypothetical protein [Sphingomonas rhizophila]QNN64344.1 hypothetical protein H9L12_08360 [Sphingomonas rhizophila]